MNNLKYSNGSATYVESLQKKIAELEKQIVAIDMNNEPVAWAVWEGRPHDLFFTKEESDELCRLKGGDAKTVPLYTHPVKEQDVKYNVTVRWDDKITHHKNVSVDTPLHYTHPVKEQDTECQYCKQGCIRCDARKQLTDEEIKQTFQEQTGFYFDDNPADDLALMDFARAILRKAQEK